MAEQKLFEEAMVLLKGESEKSNSLTESAVRFPLDWLSDLGTTQIREFLTLWRKLPAPYRRALIARMEEEARDNLELDFTAIARVTLDDGDADVRMHAIRALWECEDPKLIDRFLRLMETDPSAMVRSAAASALGAFMERAELEKIPAPVGGKILERLIRVIQGKDELEVRRRAVESIGYSSEPAVRGIIEEAYHHAEQPMKSSALFAMGHSADPAWAEAVVNEMSNSSPALRAEAARAAGALGLRNSVPQLIELLEDTDGIVRGNAISALGEIGGEKARQALEDLQTQAGGDEWDRIEEALENAEFQDSLGDLPLLNLDEEDEGEE
jgi:HEAT repeat protein